VESCKEQRVGQIPQLRDKDGEALIKKPKGITGEFEVFCSCQMGLQIRFAAQRKIEKVQGEDE